MAEYAITNVNEGSQVTYEELLFLAPDLLEIEHPVKLGRNFEEVELILEVTSRTKDLLFIKIYDYSQNTSELLGMKLTARVFLKEKLLEVLTYEDMFSKQKVLHGVNGCGYEIKDKRVLADLNSYLYGRLKDAQGIG